MDTPPSRIHPRAPPTRREVPRASWTERRALLGARLTPLPHAARPPAREVCRCPRSQAQHTLRTARSTHQHHQPTLPLPLVMATCRHTARHQRCASHESGGKRRRRLRGDDPCHSGLGADPRRVVGACVGKHVTHEHLLSEHVPDERGRKEVRAPCKRRACC